MTTLRCSICKNPTARKFIDGGLDSGLSAAAIARQIEGIGGSIDPDLISRHRKHYADGRADPIAKTGRDLAILVRDRAVEQFENEELDLRVKDHAAGITAGLKAQSILDSREKQKQKNAMAELGRGLLAMMLGGQPVPVAALEDGNTIEGEAVEVD